MVTRREPATSRSGLGRLPGWELVAAGIADLAAGRETINGELVRGASQRLADLGLIIPAVATDPRPDLLYELVVADVGRQQAHARYNALRRRMASFLRAAADARPR